MSSAIDAQTPLTLGENCHPQYGWSRDLKEKIVQFSFQLTRCGKEVVRGHLAEKFRELLSEVAVAATVDDNHVLALLMRMVAQTRDIVDGKGEYDLACMMVYELHAFYPELARCLIVHFVEHEDGGHPYGSWKDIKYLCNYVMEQEQTARADGPVSAVRAWRRVSTHPLINYAHDLALARLRKDAGRLDAGEEHISLVARWLPREKSKKFGWQFDLLARKYHSEWMDSAATVVRDYPLRGACSMEAADAKCRTHFRKLLSRLNRHLDTVQIKQAGGSWASIDHANLTSVTMRRQSRALRNVEAHGAAERTATEDRRRCATNFTEFVKRAASGGPSLKGKRVSLIDFVRAARTTHDAMDRRVLDLQWRDSTTTTGPLPNMVPMIDTSGSMTCDGGVPLDSAVGLGIRIAERSRLHNRALTFSAEPAWIRYDGCSGFVDKVRATLAEDWGFSTNFTAALKLVLSAIVEARLPPREVNDMVLVVLSDMQIDFSGNESIDESMYARIKRLYAEAGMKAHGEPYVPPTILFWNLRSTSGFPVLSSCENALMMSGCSPALLSAFCDRGIDALRDCTPWNMFVDTVTRPRYSPIGEAVDAFIAECSV